MRRGKGIKRDKDDLFIRLTAVQLIAAVLIFLLLFLLVRRENGLALRIRNEFETLMEQDWDLAGWFRGEARSVFSGEEEDGICLPAFGGEPETAAGANGAVILTAAAAAREKPSAAALTESFYEADAPVLPVVGAVTSDYGERIHPITGEESFHSGRDIAADEGTDIFSVNDGVVIDVGVGEKSGNYLKIDHGGGLVALYCHCSAIYAKEGDAVRKGDIVAAVGETGAATGPHLHFEIRLNGVLTDPSAVLDKAVRVR